MKFNCNKNILQEAISIVQKAITGKSTMPILQGIYIKVSTSEITLIGSDIDLTIETKITADILEPGNIVVDSKLFGEIIRKLSNDSVCIETLENNILEITCQKSIFNLSYMNDDEFPNVPYVEDNVTFNFSQKILKNMIRSTIFAIAQDETRPILTGVLFEVKDNKLNLVALDGFRLALRNEIIDTENTANAVIPGKTLNEVSKILEENEDNVSIALTSNQIMFTLGETRIISRLLDGEYLKYKAIIPDEHNLKITVNRMNLLYCIERASLVAKEGNTNLVKLEIGEESLVVTSNSQLGKVRDELNIILEGQPLQIAFNSKYLIDILKIMDEDEIYMQFSTNVSPCIIKNKENDNCIYLVLPVRLHVN